MRMIFACLLLAVSTSAAFAASDNWTGTWDTRWHDAGARLELHQDGDKVEGTYPSWGGTVEGTISGRVFKGHWHRDDQSGAFDFVQASDGQSFVGRYASGEWWTGTRVTGDANVAEPVDLSSPRATLRTFVRGGNAARYDAPDELVRSVAALDFGSDVPPPVVRLNRAKALFDVLDTTFFRLFDIPDKVSGDTFAVTLNQLGSPAALPLRMMKHGDRWLIVMPDEAHLAAYAKALYARSGGEAPNPADYKSRHTAMDAYRNFTHAFYDWDDGGRDDALDTLDLSGIPAAIRDYQGALAAQYIAGVLNRVGLPEPQEIPDDPKSGEPYVLFSHAAGQIAIAPVGTGKPMTWAFTRETVRDARKLFVVVEDLPVVEGWTLPQPHSTFFALRRFIRGIAPWLLTDLGTLEVWQVIGWAAVLVLSLAIGRLVTEIVMRLMLRIVGSRDAKAERRTFRYAVWGAIAFSIYKLLIPSIGLVDIAKQVSVGITGVLLIASLMWLSWITIDSVGDRFFSNNDGKHLTMDSIIVSLLFGLLKLALLVAGLVAIAIELSLPYEGIVASLSIGGLAVAFASRETLSNVFGAGVLAIDRPFKRGDFISAGGVEGTVEHVGIRSTRVRTSDDSIIIMPNGKLSDAMVNNLGTRRYHLKHANVPLPYATSVAQLKALLSGVRELVDAVPQAARPQTSVAVSGMSNDGINLDVKYALDVRHGGDEAAIANQLMLDILSLCEKVGIRASAPVAQAAE